MGEGVGWLILSVKLKKRGIFEEIIKYNVCGFFVIKNHIVMMMMKTDALWVGWM